MRCACITRARTDGSDVVTRVRQRQSVLVEDSSRLVVDARTALELALGEERLHEFSTCNKKGNRVVELRA